MKAVGYTTNLPVTESQSLLDIELPMPVASGRDLLVKVKAIAVNPVDYKIRQNVAPEQGQYKVIGWDAAGEVVATGEDVVGFEVGDEVYYAGDLTRPGSNAEYQLVDERIVGRKPQSLSDAQAAALPLTSITAYELLFDHLGLELQSLTGKRNSDQVLLITGAAGGVGSILIQLAKQLTGATVIATASREASKEWVRQLGADWVINHKQALKPQLQALGFEQVTHVASLNATQDYFETFIDLLAPFGHIALIDDPQSINGMLLKPKSLTLHLEFMFARSMFNAGDMARQGQILNHIAELVDTGVIKTTASQQLGAINAANLRNAHKILESGSAIGKIVLEGF